MGARVNFVGRKDFVNDGHGGKSLAKRKTASSERWQMLGSGASECAEKMSRHSARCELQLRFDGFGDVVETGEALEFLHHFAVAIDEEAGGITEKAAEFVGDFVAAQNDGIVHRKLLAVDVEAFLGEEGDDRALAIFVHGHAHDRESLRGVLLLHFDEPGNLDVTGFTPGGPEIDEDDGALVLRESDVFAIEIFECDFGGGLAVDPGGGLLGILRRAGGFDARGLVRKISSDDKNKHG